MLDRTGIGVYLCSKVFKTWILSNWKRGDDVLSLPPQHSSLVFVTLSSGEFSPNVWTSVYLKSVVPLLLRHWEIQHSPGLALCLKPTNWI